MPAPDSTIQRWSTDAVPEALRFDYWSDILSRSLTPMRVASADPRHFSASLAAATMGSICVVDQHGSAHETHRSAQDVERSEEHSYHLLVSVGSAWNLAHRGSIRLGRGDVVLTDSRYAHDIQVCGPYHIHHLKLAPQWLHTWVADARDLVGRRIDGNTLAGCALSSFMSGLTPQLATRAPLAPQALCDHVGALLALVAGDLDSRGPRQAVLMRRIRDCIVERCGNPGLAAADVAASLGLPARALHRILATHGRTFAALLLDTRFELAQRRLDMQAFRDLPLDDIARDAGFADPGQFRRLLKRRSRAGVATGTPSR